MELAELATKVTEIGNRIDKGLVTKEEVKAVEASVAKLEKQMHDAADKAESVPVFGNKYIAEKVTGLFFKAACNNPQFTAVLKKNDEAFRFKAAAAALTVGGSDTGDYALPTELDPIIHQLIQKYGFATKYANVIPGIQGTRNIITSADDTVTYAVADDDSATATESTPVLARPTLSLTQIVTLSRISEFLFRQSPLAMSALLVDNMARSQAKYIDTSWLYGTNGMEDNTSIPCTSVASLAAVTIDDLVDLQFKAHESADGVGFYLVSRELIPVLRKIKSGNGSSFGSDEYRLDVQSNVITINGAPVISCPRMHSGATNGDAVALYGDFRTSTVLGLGRNQELAVDSSVDFLKVGLAYRLVSDFGCAVILPTGLAKIRITSTT